METKNNSQNEESSQEDSDILANAKGYFNKYFNQLNEWNDFKKNDFNIISLETTTLMIKVFLSYLIYC